MRYFNRLLELRGDVSQTKFAEPLGLTQQNYGNYERGEQSLNSDLIVRICKHYGCTAEWLLGMDGGATKTVTADDDFADVPLYGAIAAGTPIEMVEIEATFPISRSLLERLGGINEEGEVTFFLLRVEGDSMNRILPNGCYALISPCSYIDRDNQPYAICVNGYDATIKRVRKLANGFELLPDSTDPTYKAKVYDYGEPGTDKITIIGRVVYYVLPFDWGF